MIDEKVNAAIEANLLPALIREADVLEKHVKRARAQDEHVVLSDAHVSELVALLKHATRRIEAQAAEIDLLTARAEAAEAALWALQVACEGLPGLLWSASQLAADVSSLTGGASDDEIDKYTGRADQLREALADSKLVLSPLHSEISRLKADVSVCNGENKRLRMVIARKNEETQIKGSTPAAARKAITSRIKVLQAVRDGLGAKPFGWGTVGETKSYLHLAREMGVALVTRSQIAAAGHELQPRAKPVGTCNFGKRFNTAELYVLGAQTKEKATTE